MQRTRVYLLSINISAVVSGGARGGRRGLLCNSLETIGYDLACRGASGLEVLAESKRFVSMMSRYEIGK